MKSKVYQFFISCGYTHIKDNVGSYAFQGTSTDELANHLDDIESDIARLQRKARALKAVLWERAPDSLDFTSDDTAISHPNALV